MWTFLEMDVGKLVDVLCLIFNPCADPKMRISVPVGYDNEGFLGVSLLVEEVKDSEEKLDSSWTGTLWKHSR